MNARQGEVGDRGGEPVVPPLACAKLSCGCFCATHLLGSPALTRVVKSPWLPALLLPGWSNLLGCPPRFDQGVVAPAVLAPSRLVVDSARLFQAGGSLPAAG